MTTASPPTYVRTAFAEVPCVPGLQSPASTSTAGPDPIAIRLAHGLYCSLTGQCLGLGLERERLWLELLRSGYTTDVVRPCLRVQGAPRLKPPPIPSTHSPIPAQLPLNKPHGSSLNARADTGLRVGIQPLTIPAPRN